MRIAQNNAAPLYLCELVYVPRTSGAWWKGRIEKHLEAWYDMPVLIYDRADINMGTAGQAANIIRTVSIFAQGCQRQQTIERERKAKPLYSLDRWRVTSDKAKLCREIKRKKKARNIYMYIFLEKHIKYI